MYMYPIPTMNIHYILTHLKGSISQYQRDPRSNQKPSNRNSGPNDFTVEFVRYTRNLIAVLFKLAKNKARGSTFKYIVRSICP